MKALLIIISVTLGSYGIVRWFQASKIIRSEKYSDKDSKKIFFRLLVIPLSLMAGSAVILGDLFFGDGSFSKTFIYAALGYLFFPVAFLYFLISGFLANKVGAWISWLIHGLIIILLGFKFNDISDGTIHFDFAIAMWAIASTFWFLNFLKNRFTSMKFEVQKTLFVFLFTSIPVLFGLYLVKYSILGLPTEEKSIYAQSFVTSAGTVAFVTFVFILRNLKGATQS